MTQSSLFLQQKENVGLERSLNNLSTVPNDRLWNQVVNNNIHPSLRSPALFELARRHDPRLYELCSAMVSLEDIEEWFLGLYTLRQLGTQKSIKRLLILAKNSSISKRKIILCELAKILPLEYLEDFIHLAKNLAIPGVLDATGWSSAAFSAIQQICKFKSLDIYIVDKSKFKKLSQTLAKHNNRNTKRYLIMLI
jgi:hypothetical protein